MPQGPSRRSLIEQRVRRGRIKIWRFLAPILGAALVVVLVALFLSRERLLEAWYLRALVDGDAPTQERAARELVVLKSSRAASPLFDLVLEEKRGELPDFRAVSLDARHVFFHALVGLSDAAFPEIRFRLERGDVEERALAARVAFSLGALASELVDDLLEAARSDASPSVRVLAILALGQIGSDSEIALPYLRELRARIEAGRDKPPPPFEADHSTLLAAILDEAIERIEGDFD
ncbi:MAG TPA: HEAT repeat domain-containing protein [Planctomycetota bacterium]|nr:HEAT repeat domain-containing protein [Planctomycetota bacterium]